MPRRVYGSATAAEYLAVFDLQADGDVNLVDYAAFVQATGAL